MITEHDLTPWYWRMGTGEMTPARPGVYRVRCRGRAGEWYSLWDGYWHTMCLTPESAGRYKHRTQLTVLAWRGITYDAHVRHLSDTLKPGTLEWGLAQAQKSRSGSRAIELLRMAIDNMQHALQLLAREQQP